VAADERDAALLDPRKLGRVVEPVDDFVAPREHRGHVELPAGHALDPADLGERLIGPQQRLRRHARPVRALAADQPILDDRHFQPSFGQSARRHFSRRTGPDHHDIEAPHAR
jgi:hypothetical protein